MIDPGILQPNAIQGVSPFYFYPVATALVLCSLGTVLSGNLIYAALFLLVHMVGIACLFGLLGAPFLAAVQIIVYAGAVVVLFLFVVMLLNLKEACTVKVSLFTYLLAGLSVAIFFRLVATAFQSAPTIFEPEAPAIGSAANLAEGLFMRQGFLLEFSSFLLLVAMTGAVLLAKRRGSSMPLAAHDSKD